MNRIDVFDIVVIVFGGVLVFVTLPFALFFGGFPGIIGFLLVLPVFGGLIIGVALIAWRLISRTRAHKSKSG